MVKYLIAVLCIILASLEYRFWLSKDSIFKVHKLKKELVAQKSEARKLRERNDQLIAKIENLKKYPQSIEEQARYELGMIKPNEKYYQVVEPIK